MKPSPSCLMLSIGFILVTTGMALPFLILLHIIPSTFFINFLAFTASVSGMFLGIIGSAYHFSGRGARNRRY